MQVLFALKVIKEIAPARIGLERVFWRMTIDSKEYVVRLVYGHPINFKLLRRRNSLH